MLTNALHFKAAWDVAFDPLDPTEDGSFTLGDGRTVQARMMQRSSTAIHPTSGFVFDILPGIEFKAVAIPYEVIGPIIGLFKVHNGLKLQSLIAFSLNEEGSK